MRFRTVNLCANASTYLNNLGEVPSLQLSSQQTRVPYATCTFRLRNREELTKGHRDSDGTAEPDGCKHELHGQWRSRWW